MSQADSWGKKVDQKILLGAFKVFILQMSTSVLKFVWQDFSKSYSTLSSWPVLFLSYSWSVLLLQPSVWCPNFHNHVWRHKHVFLCCDGESRMLAYHGIWVLGEECTSMNKRDCLILLLDRYIRQDALGKWVLFFRERGINRDNRHRIWSPFPSHLPENHVYAYGWMYSVNWCFIRFVSCWYWPQLCVFCLALEFLKCCRPTWKT